jgi:hypothetical protein
MVPEETGYWNVDWIHMAQVSIESEIRGSHSGNYEDYSLLACDTV